MRKDGALFTISLLPRKAAAEGTGDDILQEQAAKILRARSGVPVYIKADQSLNYGDVVRVDCVAKAGAQSVGLTRIHHSKLVAML